MDLNRQYARWETGCFTVRVISNTRRILAADFVATVAWDTMTEITFKRTLGLIDAGEDKTGILKISSGSLDYFAPVFLSSLATLC